MRCLSQIAYILFFSLCGLQASSNNNREENYKDLYPTYDEFDYSILDPETVYGSPYGGFGRATSSRLASLPLFLPNVPDEFPSDIPTYMQVRDFDGRLFACRVYHEDELHPDSLEDSMFDKPRFRIDGELSEDLSDVATELASVDKQRTELESRNVLDWMSDPAKVELEVEKRMRRFRGICGQVHKGWWSYEWCHENHLSQFHIEIDSVSEQLKIQGISKLGVFTRRIIHTDLAELPPSKLPNDKLELARVVDIFEGGDICLETNQPRISFVQFQCCPSSMMQMWRGGLHKDNVPLASDIAAIVDFTEDPQNICHYNATVCTPFLCEDNKIAKPSDSDNLSTESHFRPRENETVPGLLRRVLGDVCFQTSTGGWWTYEICHTKMISQYHEVISAQKLSDGILNLNHRDSEHILGYYVQEEEEEAGEDYKHVINSTDSRKGGGNHAYYEIEYTGGDVCDAADVTERVIVAGRMSGKLERASTVRFYCGDQYEITVSEDSTCHYIVEVKVPELCFHPLFKAPVSKKQVVKCLPVEE